MLIGCSSTTFSAQNWQRVFVTVPVISNLLMMDETVKLDTRRHRVFEPIYSDFFDTIPQSFSDVRVRVRVRGLL
jgi:hypothetical protein